jgi:hypothetical protein
MTQPQFKVNKSEADAFAKVWNYKGIAIHLDDASIQFATDFSNVVLRNFIGMCQAQAELEAKQKSNKIIVEGLDKDIVTK